jgi:hypothetical protein
MVHPLSNINYQEFSDSDEWGFYIDIEQLPSRFPNNESIIRKQYNLDNIYNFKQQFLNNYQIDIDENFNDIYKEKNMKYLIKVTSTTLITAAITYVVLFIL